MGHRRRRRLTTLVATAAVAPFAIYHFHRLSHYGVVANLIALPLVGLLIMPFALVSLVAMPLGLESGPLQVMGLGIDLLSPPANGWRPGPAPSRFCRRSRHGALLMVLGGLWLCLWQTRWRALGLVIVAAGLLVSGEGTKPDVLVERDGRNVALRAEDGSLALPPATKANYSVDNWLLADGEDRDAEEVAANSPFRCDLIGCIGKVKGKTIALIRHPGGTRGGLPHRRYRHRAVQRRQRVQHGTRGGRPARATGRRRACDLYRGAVDQERERCRDARAEALGAGACPSEAVSAGWPGLRPRSRCRRRRG